MTRFFGNLRKMAKAIQVSETGDISVLKYTTVPMPTIKPTQLLVKNHYAGINFIDTYHRTGLYKLPLPFIPGRYVIDNIAKLPE